MSTSGTSQNILKSHQTLLKVQFMLTLANLSQLQCRKTQKNLWLVLFLVLAPFLSHSLEVSAQIIPDNTLPNNSIVISNGNLIEITGGTTAGNNLFHSFQDFSVLKDQIAFFNNELTIENILSRITGSSISNLDGLIRANGGANLFLINPNGIIFGENARLDIGGSFLGSTADSIVFPEGEFSATDTQTPPLLTINAPIGLNFGETPGTIVNQSRVEADSELIGRSNTGDLFTAGLQVKQGKTLALVGGDVVLDGGNLTANEGRIELGSVGENSSVNITLTEQGFVLGYDQVQNFRDISFFSGTIVDTSGEVGGEIQLQGRQITLTGDALGSSDTPPVLVFSNTVGEGQGGTLTVNASEAIELSGDFTALWTQTDGTGNAGKLLIETGRLTVRDGGEISTSTFGSGDSIGDKLGKKTICQVIVDKSS